MAILTVMDAHIRERLDDAIAALGAATEYLERSEVEDGEELFRAGKLYATIVLARGMCLVARELSDNGD